MYRPEYNRLILPDIRIIIVGAMKLTLIILLLFIAVHSNAQTAATTTDFVLKVTMSKLSEPKKLYLLYNASPQKIIDSSLSVNGTFNFKGPAKTLNVATLVLDQNGVGLKKIMQRPPSEADMINIYLHPGNIEMQASDSILKGTFKTSEINKDNLRLQASLKPSSDALLKLMNSANQNQDAGAIDAVKLKYDSLSIVRKQILKNFAIKNPKSYMSLLALQDYAGPDPVNLNEIWGIFNSFHASLKNSKEGKNYHQFLENGRKLSLGGIAPEFTQLDTAGKPVKLSSFRGKYVLLDFWASWCGPCRIENPNLVNVYKKFKDQNFTILGVSLDRPEGKNAWLNAIKKDNLEWTQVSDLKFWTNDVARLYGINAIPQNFLIDPTGKIVAKNIRGKDLEKKLSEILSSSNNE